MKIFDKIKKHISDKLIEYGLKEDVQIKYINCITRYDVDFDRRSVYNTSSNTFVDEGIPSHIVGEFAKNFISYDNFYSKEKKIILEKIYNDCCQLNECLKPLKSIGIDYSIDLMGGAVRDYLLDKHNEIKDLDILIKFSAFRPWNSDAYWAEDEQERRFIKENLIGFCSAEELVAVDFNDNDNLNLKHNKLAQICLSRKTPLTFVNLLSYSDRVYGQTLYGDNILRELCGMMKIKKGVFNYEIDLLLTDTNTRNFIKNIDFNICNLGIRMIDTGSIEHNTFSSLDFLPNRMYAANEFFEDVMNKTITFNVKNKTIEQIKHSLGDHRERLLEKYKDYTLKISRKHSNHEAQSLIEKMMLHHELDSSFHLEATSVRKNKKIKL
jgi:hypothetical protein